MEIMNNKNITKKIRAAKQSCAFVHITNAAQRERLTR